eukprot:1140506-Pelagomonas_calceolata.AAC.3
MMTRSGTSAAHSAASTSAFKASVVIPHRPIAKDFVWTAQPFIRTTCVLHSLVLWMRAQPLQRPRDGAVDAFTTIVKTEGITALYKGLVPTLPAPYLTLYKESYLALWENLYGLPLVGVAPYAAINFASYDMAKKLFYHGERCVLQESHFAPEGNTG